MCGLALPLCLLLWISTAVSKTQARVTSSGDLSTEVGLSLLLGCNVTLGPGETVKQVRWVTQHRKVILAYEQVSPVRISHQEPNVRLTTTHNNASYITIKSVRPRDDGCYRCVFDVYPSGPLEGKMCISVTDKVSQEGNKTAVSGKSVVLSCWYSHPEKVQQVLWRKTAEQGDTTTVASTGLSHHSIEEPYKGWFSLSRSLGDTRLTIQEVRTEDEGCYTCEFHVFPDGTKSKTACLSVYVLPKPEVSHVTQSPGVTEANCTAQARPAAEITWNVAGDNRTMGPPISSSYEQGDGTTVVTSTLLFQSALINEQSVKCIVHHPGLEKPLTVVLHTMVGPATVVLLSVCGVVAVLLLCLCVCLCKCFICTDD